MLYDSNQVLFLSGVILSQESDGIWAYNISSQPIFVNSPTVTADMYSNLNNNSSPYRGSASLCVYRVSPGHCLCIHDPFRAEPLWRQQCLLGEQQLPPTGPIDPNSIRISFVKGWGPNYTRSEITTCPCWLEVLLAPCRWCKTADSCWTFRLKLKMNCFSIHTACCRTEIIKNCANIDASTMKIFEGYAGRLFDGIIGRRWRRHPSQFSTLRKRHVVERPKWSNGNERILVNCNV